MSNQSTKNSGMNDDGMLNAETQRKLPQGKISQPKLRFKGFTDPWQQRKLGEVINEYVDFAVNEINLPVATSSRSGLHLQSDYFDGGHTGIDSSLTFRRVPEGYITYRHMSDDSIFHFNENRLGRTVLVSKEYPVFSCTTLIDQSFLLNVLNYSADFRAFAIRQKKGGTRTRLYFSVLQNFIVSLPTIAEQARIGEFFRVLDDLIAAAKKKADLLKLKKRYYLQAIFSQQLRFKGFTGPWQQRKLGDLLKFERPDRYIEPDGDYLSKGATPVLTANKGFVLGYTNNPEGIYDKGPCVIFDDFTLDRKLVRCPFKVRSSAIKILTANPSVDLYFMFELLEFQKFPSLGHARHYISVVEPWRTPVPDYLEQTHIGEMFRVMDDLIVAVTRRIELLERQKTAYLQCLFV